MSSTPGLLRAAAIVTVLYCAAVPARSLASAGASARSVQANRVPPTGYAAPIAVVAIEPRVGGGPRDYRVRLRVTGIALDAEMVMTFDGAYLAGSEFGDRVAVATVHGVTLDGPGELIPPYGVNDGPVIVGSCPRGGRIWAPQHGQPYTLRVPSSLTTDLLVDVTTEPGLTRSDPPVLVIESTALLDPSVADRARHPPRFTVDVPLPTAPGPSAEGVALAVRRLSTGEVVATGELRSHRRGVAVEFVGIRRRLTGSDGRDEARWPLLDPAGALAPARGRLRIYGRATTGVWGAFRARLHVPVGVELVARTPDGPKLVAAGASCPATVPRP